MRSFLRHVFLLVLLIKTCYTESSSNASSDDGLDDAQKSNSRRVVDTSVDGDHRRGRWSTVDVKPKSIGRSLPRHIYRLYERYRRGDVVHGADTVRSVNAQLALVQNSVLYVFDLSPISVDSEDVVYSEIHIYQRRRWFRGSNRSPRLRDVDVAVNIYEMTPSSLVQRTCLTVHGRSRGWQTLNVTDVVAGHVEALRDRTRYPSMIAVSFADMAVNGSGDERMPSRLRFSIIRRRFSRPLLMVYSRKKLVNDDDEEEAQSEDSFTLEYVQTNKQKAANELDDNLRRRQIDTKKSSKTAKDDITLHRLTDETITSSGKQKSRRRQSSVAGGKNRRRDEQWQKHGNSSRSDGLSKYSARNRMTTSEAVNDIRRRRRTRRSVLDNEVDVPDDDVPLPDYEAELAAGASPNLLHGGINRQKVGFLLPESEEVTRDKLLDAVFDAGKRKNEDARGRRRKDRVRGRRRKQSSLMELLRNPDDYFNNRQRSSAADASCKKKRLRVNFADIGWREWIIAPDFVDAFYCDGSCSFPIARKLRPTNHATLQSIVRAVGIETNLPSPCCVPASLTSVTLLYFDQHDNVVLKNFPDMSVKSCVCR